MRFGSVAPSVFASYQSHGAPGLSIDRQIDRRSSDGDNGALFPLRASAELRRKTHERRMSRGTADDDAPIEITPEIIEGSLEADAPVGASRPSFTTAAAADPEADLAFYLEEAAQGDAARAPGLLYEIGRIRERALGDG